MQVRPVREVSPVSGEGWKLYGDSKGRMRLDFEGPTQTAALERCLRRLTAILPPEGAVDIVVDLTHLEGHNPDSRTLWKEWLTEHKRKVGEVTVLIPNRNPIVKMVASAVGLAVGIRLRVAASVDD